MAIDNVQYLTDAEIQHFIKDLDQNSNGYIDYYELEHKLDDVVHTLDPKPKPHHLHHPSREDAVRHAFLRSVIGTDKDMISHRDFAESVRKWNIPSLEQDRKEARDEDEYLKKISVWRRMRSWWAVRGPEVGFLALVVGMQLAFGIWQLHKYLTQTQYRRAFGWGVVLAKTSAGVLYPTFFFLILSMSRYFATFLRRYYLISRFINWDLNQSFHVKMSIVALFFASLHAIGHLTGSFLYGSRTSRQNHVAQVLGADAVPKPYVEYVRSRPGWSGLTAFGLFWLLAALSMPAIRRWNYEVFQLVHLLMFPIIGLLCAHGTAGLLQWPMFGYWLAFPTLLVLIERTTRLALVFRRIPAELEILDSDTVLITATIPKTRLWQYRAGQYVLVQVPKVSLFQWHPFTVSTCVGNTMQVHIKTDGDWTTRVRQLARKGASEPIFIGLDGPYGAPAERFYDFDYSMVFGGGIGVTPFSGILTDLQHKEPEHSKLQEKEDHDGDDITSSRHSCSNTPAEAQPQHRVDFHWMVRTRNYLLWFSDLLNSIVKDQSLRSCKNNSLEINIYTYVTQKRKDMSVHIFRWLLEKHRTEEHPKSPLTGLINPTHFGRPDLAEIMDGHYEDMRKVVAQRRVTGNQSSKAEDANDKDVKVGVFFCGPPIVGYQLADRCRVLTTKGRTDGSRIAYHFMMEVFG